MKTEAKYKIANKIFPFDMYHIKSLFIVRNNFWG